MQLPCKVYYLALMLVLVKCYDNKMVKATPHLFHPFVDSAFGGLPTTTTKKSFFRVGVPYTHSKETICYETAKLKVTKQGICGEIQSASLFKRLLSTLQKCLILREQKVIHKKYRPPSIGESGSRLESC